LPLDLTLDTLVNGASGLLIVVVGLGLAGLGRRRFGNILLGIGVGAYGGEFVLFNLAPNEWATSALIGAGICCAISLGALIWSLWVVPEPNERPPLWVLSAGAILLLAQEVWLVSTPREALAAAYGLPPSVATAWSFDAAFAGPTFLMLLIFGWACADWSRRHPTDERAYGLALLATGLSLFEAVQAQIWAANKAFANSSLLLLAGVGVLSFTWVAAALAMGRGGLRRAGFAAALFPPGLSLFVGLLEISRLPLPAFTVGLARTMGTLLVGVGVLRFGILGPSVRMPTIERATTATLGLAALVMGSQVAESFLSSSGSVVAGAIVAGVVVVLKDPLQAAIRPRPRPAPSAGSGASPSGNEETFRNALRVALRSNPLARADEVRLHELATALGIPAGRAHQILVDVEAETRAGLLSP
jgi:hypothetical protein